MSPWPRERGRYRPDRPHPPIQPVRAHARLLDVDDVRPYRLHHVIAEAKPLQHAGRKSLGHDVADAHKVLGDLQALRMADVQRNAALAGILVVELSAHVVVLDPRQRTSRGIARRASADRRHRRQPRVGIVLPLHLETFRAHRGEEPRAARPMPGTRRNRGFSHPATGTACHASPTKRVRMTARLRRHAGTPRGASRAPFRYPRPATAHAGRPANSSRCSATCWWDSGSCGHVPDAARRQSSCAAANVRRAHSRAACASAPTAGRHPAPPPRHVGIGPGANEALHHIEHVRPRLVAGRAIRAPAAPSDRHPAAAAAGRPACRISSAAAPGSSDRARPCRAK